MYTRNAHVHNRAECRSQLPRLGIPCQLVIRNPRVRLYLLNVPLHTRVPRRQVRSAAAITEFQRNTPRHSRQRRRLRVGVGVQLGLEGDIAVQRHLGDIYNKQREEGGRELDEERRLVSQEHAKVHTEQRAQSQHVAHRGCAAPVVRPGSALAGGAEGAPRACAGGRRGGGGAAAKVPLLDRRFSVPAVQSRRNACLD